MQYLVCATIGNFADDVAARCDACDAQIVHRPNVKPGLVKICGTCAATLFAAEPDAEVRVTEETRRELALYYAKPKGGPQ
jgi:hypothetical protein